MIHMEYYLIVSAIMFFAGIYGFFYPPQHTGDTYQHRADSECHGHQLCGVQRFLFPGGLEGYFFSLSSIVHLGGETAVAIAIMINIYRNIRSIQVNKLDEMNGRAKIAKRCFLNSNN